MPEHQIVGELASNAEMRACLGGAYVIELRIKQPTDSTYGLRPIHGTWQRGHGQAAAAAAATAAAQMRAGSWVRVWCTGIDVGYGPGNRAEIEITGITAVQSCAAPEAAGHHTYLCSGTSATAATSTTTAQAAA